MIEKSNGYFYNDGRNKSVKTKNNYTFYYNKNARLIIIMLEKFKL